eukprot:TRINITY_DN2913_c0_g1_i3.p5 TRINITY_DN2913_c0_g1~~TRINITY_DN2913_c0_g1_i3.p5  ORF type:complete len:205 (-),score=81.75 TRINITY_DN2913_c0_g1_i3:243-857(-)
MALLHEVYAVVLSLWPQAGRYKNYVDFPKANGYRSIHTTVRLPTDMLMEIQVRTKAMHREAESGAASHSLYKGGLASPDAARAFTSKMALPPNKAPPAQQQGAHARAPPEESAAVPVAAARRRAAAASADGAAAPSAAAQEATEVEVDVDVEVGRVATAAAAQGGGERGAEAPAAVVAHSVVLVETAADGTAVEVLAPNDVLGC